MFDFAKHILIAASGSRGPQTTFANLCLALLAASTNAQYTYSPCPGGQCPIDAWQPSTYAPRAIPATPPHPAVCRVINATGRTENIGSGTLISTNGKTGMVLTCAHLFSDGTGRIIVQFASGQRHEANLLDVDQVHDLAALAVARPEVAPMSPDFAAPSGQLSACGYGPSGRYACIRGAIVGYATPVGARYPSLQMRGAARSGDSGGAVMNAQDRLVGVIWGQRDGVTYATFGQPLREFLARITNSRRDENIAARPSVADAPSTSPADSTTRPEADAPASPSFDFATFDRRLSSVEEQIKRWPPSDQLVTRDDASEFASQSDLERFKHEISSAVEAKEAAIVGAVRERLSKRVGVFEGLTAGRMLVGALGISGPLGIAIVGATAILGRRVRRRVKNKLRPNKSDSAFCTPHSDRTPHSAFPIAVDTPPPPQRTVAETHYVPYERDEFSRAYQWASEQVARKYPGSIETLTTLDSLIKQQVNARSE